MNVVTAAEAKWRRWTMQWKQYKWRCEDDSGEGDEKQVKSGVDGKETGKVKGIHYSYA